MVKLKNNTTEIKKDKDSFMSFADLIIAVANQESREGYNVEEMRKRLRIVEVANTQSKELEFEDEDFKKLKELVETMKWGLVHPDLLVFSDEVTKLEVK